MADLEFSALYNNDPDTLEGLFKLKNVNEYRRKEIYLSRPQQYSAAGRIVQEIYEPKFIGIVDQIHNQGVRVNLVMNPTCEGTEYFRPDPMNM